MPKLKLNPTVNRKKKAQVETPYTSSVSCHLKSPCDNWVTIDTEDVFVQYQEGADTFYLRPLLIASYSGIYPTYIGGELNSIRWVFCDNQLDTYGRIDASDENTYIIADHTEAETDLILREAFYKQWKVTSEYWDKLIYLAWERTQIRSNYKCKAHNYLCEKGFKIIQILKCTVKHRKVYVSYLFNKHGVEVKGSTIIGQTTLDDIFEEKYFTYIPVMSEYWNARPWVQKQGYMVSDGYKILLNDVCLGYVVAFEDGYVLIDPSNVLINDRENIKPQFDVDWWHYQNAVTEDIYDAAFTKNPLPGSTKKDVSSTIYLDPMLAELNKAAEKKGFGLYVQAKKAKQKQLSAKNAPKFDAYGRPTAANEMYQHMSNDTEVYEEEEEDI